MANESLQRLLEQLDAAPASSKRQALRQLREMMSQHGIALADSHTPASTNCGPLTCPVWRAISGVGLAAALLFLGSLSSGNSSALGCHVTDSVEPRRPLVPIGRQRSESNVIRNRHLDSRTNVVQESIIAESSTASSESSSELTPAEAGNSRSRYPSHPAFDPPLEAILRVKPNRKTSNFPLLVCIGHGKTATKSLNKALVMLGMNTAHFYGAGVYSLLYDNAAEQKDKEFLFNVNEAKHVAAVLDTPVVDFYQEIALAYPNAKFILTIREPAQWLKSQQKFYSFYAQGCKNWLAPWRRGSNLVYGTECPTPVQAIKRYHQHNRNVIDALPKNRLLVMDIPGGDGWEKLCPFLGIAIPDNTHGNMSFPNRH